MSTARLEQLFSQHSRAVYAYALRRVGADTADEVVTTVFTVAWRKLDQVPADEPLLWLYAVARRAAANENRAARRRSALSTALRPLAREVAEEPRRDGALVAALRRLSRRDQEVLMLTAWEGLGAREAGVVLGCSEAAVHTRLHRARARLRRQLDEHAPAAGLALTQEGT